MNELNWRLRPETAQEIEKSKQPSVEIDEKHIEVIEKFFEKE